MGSYRCGCPEGFVQHLYYNQCIDENECNTSPCGDNTCINTIGSYKCGCPDGYQFDGNLQICVQVSFRFQRLIIRDYYFRCEKKNLMYFRWALDASEALAPLVAPLTGQMDSSADVLPGINELDRFVIDVTLGYFDVTFIYFLPFDFQWSGSLFVHDQSTIARTLWRRHQQCTDVRDKSRSVSYTACGWQDNIDGRLLFLQGDLTIIPDHRVVRRWTQQRKKNYFLFRRLTGKEDTEGICERNQWIKNWSHGGTKLWRDDSSDQQRGTIMGKSISSRSVFGRPDIEWESSNYNRPSRFISLYINFFFSFFARSECSFNFKNWKQG